MTTWADKFGTEDKEFMRIFIENGKFNAKIEKPDNMEWTEFINVLAYLIAQDLSKSADDMDTKSAGDDMDIMEIYYALKGEMP